MRRLIAVAAVMVVAACSSEAGQGGSITPGQTASSQRAAQPESTVDGVPKSTAVPPSVSVPAPPKGPDGSAPVVEHGNRAKPLVALTFDADLTEGMQRKLETGAAASYDGAPVVDELQRLKVPGTFFLTGLWVRRYPETAARIAADPAFEAGSHSYSHRAFAMPCYGLEGVPAAEAAQDVRRSYEQIRAKVPAVTPYFRFPGGCHDPAALKALGPVGVTAVQWDVVSGDAFGTSVDAIVRASVSGARNGSIIVMHSTLGTAPLTAKALARIVEGLRAKGLRPAKLSEVLAD